MYDIRISDVCDVRCVPDYLMTKEVRPGPRQVCSGVSSVLVF